jgi:hypothetical protein
MTPGYNSRITIRLSADRHGRPLAHYWGRARRWIRLPMDEAQMLLATEAADNHAVRPAPAIGYR